MEIVLFIVSSILVSRVLEKSKYRLAVIAHSVLFIVFLFVYFFSSDWEPLIKAGKYLIGEGPYGALHEVLSEQILIGTRISYNAIMLGEIVTLTSLAFLATRAFIKAKAKLVSRLAMQRKAIYISEPIIKANDSFEEESFSRGGKSTCLLLSRLRN